MDQDVIAVFREVADRSASKREGTIRSGGFPRRFAKK